jgi:flagellar biosynthesis protein FliQ
MTPQAAVDLFRQALLTAFWIGLPLLAIGFIASVLISLLQIVTSMQDSAFGSIPRTAAFLVGIVILLPWMLMRMMAYTTSLLGDLGRYGR